MTSKAQVSQVVRWLHLSQQCWSLHLFQVYPSQAAPGCPNTNGSSPHLNYFSSNTLCDGEEVVRNADKNLGLTYNVTRNARTRGQFKPKHASKGTSSYQLRQFAEATLGSGSLRKAVKLPEGEDLSEWLAVNSNENTVSA